MSPPSLAAELPLFPLHPAVKAVGGNPVASAKWLRTKFFRDLPPEYLEKPGSGARVRAALSVVVQVCAATPLVHRGVRLDDALTAGLMFSDAGAPFPFYLGTDPGEARVPDEKNREPGKLYAGRVGTWLIYDGPRNFRVVPDSHERPLRLGAAFAAAQRFDDAEMSLSRIVVDLEEVCVRIARALDLPFVETFKTPSRA